MNIWKGKVLTEIPFGHVLIVVGQIKPHPHKISWELTDQINGELGKDSIFLRININFGETQTIHSICQSGSSNDQPQEITKNWKYEINKNSLAPGKLFTIRVAVLQKSYEIYVNDCIYGVFDNVSSSGHIQYSRVKGDFEKITQFHQRMLFPLIFPKILAGVEKIAFQSDVPRKYEIGTVVVMEGIIKGSSSTEFSICFQCNDTGRIILKFHVNFALTQVIRTSQREDNSFSPDDEETDGEFPFQLGKLFKIAFGVGSEAFVIAINGHYFTYYNYPCRSFAISTLKCFSNNVGDFTVKNLEYYSDSALLTRVENFSKF